MVVIGRSAGLVETRIDTVDLLRQKTITGTMGGSIEPRRHIPEFVDLYLAGRLDLDGLMDAEYRLDEIGRAFDELDRGLITRGVVRF